MRACVYVYVCAKVCDVRLAAEMLGGGRERERELGEYPERNLSDISGYEVKWKRTSWIKRE